MVTVDDIKRFLEQHGFELISQPGYRIQIFVHPAANISVKIDDRSQKKD